MSSPAEDNQKAMALMDVLRQKIGQVEPGGRELCVDCIVAFGACFWGTLLQSGSVASALTLYKQSQEARSAMLARCKKENMVDILRVELTNEANNT